MSKRPTLVYMLPPAVITASGLKLVSKGQRGIRSRIFKRLRRPGIDSKESIRKAHVALQAGATNRVIEPEFENVQRARPGIDSLELIPETVFLNF